LGSVSLAFAAGPLLDAENADFEEFEDLELSDSRLLTETQTEPEHEGVPTNTTAQDAEIEEDWEHDFEILKPIVTARGFNTSGARRLCELPAVYCDYGYRRRVTTYAQTLMDNDWIGRDYMLVMPLPEDPGVPAIMDASLFSLRRVGYFQVYVNSGPMPAGIENLSAAMVWIQGNKTHGLEGDVPDGFWSMRTRMLLLAMMGPQFTATLPQELPLCEHVDYRLYFYRLQGFSGDVSALKQCNKITDTVEVFYNPLLGGNVFDAMLGWDNLMNGSINLWGCNFTGLVPTGDVDPWLAWCSARKNTKLRFRVSQIVEGPLPDGFAECSDIFSRFYVANNQMTGNFPLRLQDNKHMIENGVCIWGNSFTGPIPDIPAQVTAIDFSGNRWSGDVPTSWFSAPGLSTVDLSDCEMSGTIPNIPPSVTSIDLSKNRLTGMIPESWFDANLEQIDLSDNNISGPPFSWGWVGGDTDGNKDPDTFLTYNKKSPEWPLKKISLSRNPLGISVGFLMGMLVQYQLEEIQAASCSLSGFLYIFDLYAQEEGDGGGLQTRSGADAFTKLKVLNVANNDLQNIGFNDLSGTKSLCWPSDDLEVQLPNLKTLDLSHCKELQKIHPKLFELDLDLRGTPLLGENVRVNASSCREILGQPVPTCDGATWSVCFYLVLSYSTISNDATQECGLLMAEGPAGTLEFDATAFRPDVLCREVNGYETSTRGSMVLQVPEAEAFVEDPLAKRGIELALAKQLETSGGAATVSVDVSLSIVGARRLSQRKLQAGSQVKVDFAIIVAGQVDQVAARESEIISTLAALDTAALSEDIKSNIQSLGGASYDLAVEELVVLSDEGDEASEDGGDEASEDGGDVTIIAVVVVVAVLILAAAAAACYYKMQKDKQRKSSEKARKEQSANIEIQINTDSQMASQGAVAMNSSEFTGEVFQNADVAQVIAVGLSEHWIIPGEQIKNFESSQTFAGGFGEVRRASLHGSTDVALKTPRVEDGNAISVYTALMNEMRLLRRIRHPNIILFHGASILRPQGAETHMMCLVLEWASGGDLGGFVKKRRDSGAFQQDCAIGLKDKGHIVKEHKILTDAARGLLYLHSQQVPILHRDLKPGNILIEEGDPPRGKLADFGLSVILQADETKRAGSSSYMAPEVYEQGKPYNKPADLWSFGCVCYFVLTGHHPKRDHSEEHQEAMRMIGDIPVLAKIGVWCLKPDPETRPDALVLYNVISQQYDKLDAKIQTELSTYSGAKNSSTQVTKTPEGSASTAGSTTPSSNKMSL